MPDRLRTLVSRLNGAPPPRRLPRGSQAAAELALNVVAVDFGEGDIIAGHLPELARAALLAAYPLIERAVRREVAREVLWLDDYDGTTRRGNKGPYCDMRTSLRRLSRGEPLPELPLEAPRD